MDTAQRDAAKAYQVEFPSREAMKAAIGREVALSPWITVNQDMIQRYAEAVGDFTWIHVDVERCRRESPFGRPIAHGLLTLSLLPQMRFASVELPPARQSLNYGFENTRMIAPVPVDSRVRGRFTVIGVDEPDARGYVNRMRVTVEREGDAKPVLVADWLNWRSRD